MTERREGVTPHATYLDHAASTPMYEAAIEAMLPFLRDRFANPSGAHALARDAGRAVDDAREVMADALGCLPGEVVFTGGGTEADNLGVLGVVDAARAVGLPDVAVCSKIEHHAVLHPVQHTGGRTVAVDDKGRVDLDALASALDADVAVVSVMLANNEIGTIQPLGEVSEIVRRRAPGAVLHTDAVQAFPWLDVADLARPADLVSVSAHKFGGPKGVGALVVRGGARVSPRLFGGGQERDRRSGTHNVAGIVAMAAAARITVDERKATVDRVAALRDRLADGLLTAIDGAVESAVPTAGDRGHKIAGNCHVCVDGVESEALLFLLERAGIMASAASSCASGAQDPSHVLAALGYPRALALGSLRLSLGVTTTGSDVDRALEAVPAGVERLRRLGS
ncbi:MAG: cysteine desulfurase family protein [Acidimicrobiales bacterium]